MILIREMLISEKQSTLGHRVIKNLEYQGGL
jgi:hypothetical protein